MTTVRKGAGYTTTRSYRPTDGVLTDLSSSNGVATVQNMTFGFDGLGNLTSRADTGVSGFSNVTESFTYDNLNRLETTTVPGTGGSTTIAYQANGNISSKGSVYGAVNNQALSITAYDTNRPHAVKDYSYRNQNYAIAYDANGNVVTRTAAAGGGNPAVTWDIKWAGFDKPRWMAKTTGTTTAGSEFHYNANRSRVLQLEFDQLSGGAPSRYVRKRTYALGSTLELNYDAAPPALNPTWNLKKVRIYVPGPDGIIGTREFDVTSGTNGTEKALVYHYDHLGSITATTLHGQTTVALDGNNKPGKFSEDAWGQRRDPRDWLGAPDSAATDDGGPNSVTPRGYTGHEMLDDLGLVHMNGRIYDPLLGRFLSADVIVEHPVILQAFNRYSYVKNNPLSFTDPTGYSTAAMFWNRGPDEITTYFILGEDAAMEVRQFNVIKAESDVNAGVGVALSAPIIGEIADIGIGLFGNEEDRANAALSIYVNIETSGLAPNYASLKFLSGRIRKPSETAARITKEKATVLSKVDTPPVEVAAPIPARIEPSTAAPAQELKASAANIKSARAPATDNYRGRYNAARHEAGLSRLPDSWDAHHRIPQEYRDHADFKDFDFDAPSNIQGVKGSRAEVNTHQDLTNDWANFRKENPNATGDKIRKFAEEMDKKYKDHWFK